MLVMLNSEPTLKCCDEFFLYQTNDKHEVFLPKAYEFHPYQMKMTGANVASIKGYFDLHYFKWLSLKKL